MNELGGRAQRFYQDHLPSQYASIPDTNRHFTELGEELATLVSQTMLDLAGPDLPQETYLEKVGRLNAARAQAVELVMHEQVFSLAPERGDIDQTDLSPGTVSALEEINLLMEHLQDD